MVASTTLLFRQADRLIPSSFASFVKVVTVRFSTAKAAALTELQRNFIVRGDGRFVAV